MDYGEENRDAHTCHTLRAHHRPRQAAGMRHQKMRYAPEREFVGGGKNKPFRIENGHWRIRNMNGLIRWSVGVLCVLWFISAKTHGQDTVQVNGPVEYTYRTVDDRALKAYVFQPANGAAGRAAIVIFHGGGWSIGEPEWAFGRARHFAARGMTAVAAQYRLSDQKSITPVEAMADARAVIHWMRTSAAALGINPKRIAAYGWSAGGHLAVSAAIFSETAVQGGVSSSPDALVLVSPALHLEKDGWVQRLLGTRAEASSISPASHVRKGLPPTLILQGSDDTVTPLEGARLFADRMRDAGNRCDMQVYPGVGHLFTPAGTRDDGWPQPDVKVQALAFKKADDFLISLGLMR